MRRPRNTVPGTAAAAVAVVLAANLVFLLLALTTRPPENVVRERVAQAFAAGDLVMADYLPWDARRGWHQYNDCNVLQMLLNPNQTQLAGALSPVIYKADPEFSAACPVLHGLATGDLERADLLSFRYARYWHGYSALAGLGLRAMDLGDLRRVSGAAMGLAVLTLAFVSWMRGGRVRLTGMAIALAAAGFWAAPYFAPNLTHGPGDILVLVTVAGVAAWPGMVERPRALAAWVAASGAFTAWLEMLTGQLPTAAAWLAAATLAAAADRSVGSPRTPGGVAALALLVFGLAAGTTVVIKQTLAFAFAAPEAGRDFLAQLHQYTAVVQDVGDPGAILLPYLQIARRADVLTWGSEIGAIVLVAALSVGWLVALARAWQHRTHIRGDELLMLACLAMIPVAWVSLLPHHSYVHAGFMIRIFVVPVALVPVALLWPLATAPAVPSAPRSVAHQRA